MGKYTRWSVLLVEAMRPDLREQFFSGKEESVDEEWDLFETVNPESAKTLYEDVLKPKLEELVSDLKFHRLMNVFAEKNDHRKATMLKIQHSAAKIKW